jgi:uncharacterized protein involved in type VI secretion and phage assembly
MNEGSPTKYYGKYRGKVLNNVDPEFLGRIWAVVPDVSALLPTSWCLPCSPYVGKQMGAFFVPQIGANVWIEFEQGNPDYPIWSGGFYGLGDVPALALAGVPGDPNVVIQTALQNTIVVSDLPGPTGGIMLKSTTGATLIVNDTGIYIQNGKGASITMIGPAVTINAGALTVI